MAEHARSTRFPLKKIPNMSVEKVCVALKKAHGLISMAAEDNGWHSGNLRRYIKGHQKCLDALVEARQKMGDVAESKLFEKIEAGDMGAIQFYLMACQKERGYGFAKDQTLHLGDNKNFFVQSVNIVAVPTGHFIPADDVAERLQAVLGSDEEPPDTQH